MMAYQYANMKNYLHGIAFKERLAVDNSSSAIVCGFLMSWL
jgi:hypothetical protein